MIQLPENNFNPKNKQEWRDWLEANHLESDDVWLVIYKKSSPHPNLKWDEAADEALCFGWIDGDKRPIDSLKYMQFFSKRKAESTWSKINKDKVAKFIEQGLMAEAGLQTIETAKQNGFWTVIDSVEQLIIPDDLENAFSNCPDSRTYFMNLSKSIRRSILQWVELSDQPETRQIRINEIAECASKSQKPKQF